MLQVRFPRWFRLAVAAPLLMGISACSTPSTPLPPALVGRENFVDMSCHDLQREQNRRVTALNDLNHPPLFLSKSEAERRREISSRRVRSRRSRKLRLRKSAGARATIGRRIGLMYDVKMLRDPVKEERRHVARDGRFARCHNRPASLARGAVSGRWLHTPYVGRGHHGSSLLSGPTMEIAGVTLLCVAGLSYIAGLTKFIWGPIISAVIG